MENRFYAVIRVDYNQNKYVVAGRLSKQEADNILGNFMMEKFHHHQDYDIIEYAKNSKENIFNDYFHQELL